MPSRSLLHGLRNDAPATNLAWLIAHQDEMLSPGASATFHAWSTAASQASPSNTSPASQNFMRLPFHVNRDVLIPRPETEHLVDKRLQWRANLSAATHRRRRHGLRRNCRRAGAQSSQRDMYSQRIFPHLRCPSRAKTQNRMASPAACASSQGDLLAPVVGQSFDIVVSNPPYVSLADRESLSVEVRGYEPAQALFAGDHGLAIYRRLIPAAFGVLAPGGFLVLEIGHGQAEAVHALLIAAGFAQVEFTADLQGIPRVASARRP